MIITKATDIMIALAVVVLFGQRTILYLMAQLFLLGECTSEQLELH